MAKRDTTAVRVDPGRIERQAACDSARLQGKSLVRFDDFQSSNLHPDALERCASSQYWDDAHVCRIHTLETVGDRAPRLVRGAPPAPPELWRWLGHRR